MHTKKDFSWIDLIELLLLVLFIILDSLVLAKDSHGFYRIVIILFGLILAVIIITKPFRGKR